MFFLEKNITNGILFVCRHVLFIQSQQEYLCMAWTCTVPCGHILQLGAGGFSVSMEYLQGTYLHSCLPSSSELIHRTRKQ